MLYNQQELKMGLDISASQKKHYITSSKFYDFWTKKVQKLLKKYGYIPIDFDSSIYHNPDSKSDQQIIIAFYVNDDLIILPSTTEILHAKSMLKSNF